MTHAIAEDQGLVCGFRLAPVESCDVEVLKSGATGRPLWLHFNLADARARRWLEHESGLDAATVRELLEPEPRIHVERAGEGVVAILGDLHHDFGRDPEGLGHIRIYVDGRRMISVRRDRLRTSDRVRRDLLRGSLAIDTPVGLFDFFIDRLAATLGDAVEKFTDEVDFIEDEVLAGRFQSQGGGLGRVRRIIARLRRHIGANRAALSALRALSTTGAFGTGGERERLSEAIERFDATAQDLEILYERTRLLQEEIAGRLAEATNRNLFLLSIITVALLPITLITGIFGMNVGGLPWVDSPHGFRWVMLGIVAGVSVALYWLYRRRVL